MLFGKSKNKSVFDVINDYLIKKGHRLLMSIFLSEYNGNNIYIRFDFLPKLSVYKIVWVDINFFDEKHIDDFINMQMITKFVSISLVEKMMAVDYESDFITNEDIVGDRVEILSYFNDTAKEYVFDRFLPLEWEKLIEPLVLVFSYLPRGMDVFLNEMLGKFDGTEEKYNYSKPVKFDLLKGDLAGIFRPISLEGGAKLYEDGKVTFLEKVGNRYFALVKDRGSHFIVLDQVDPEHALVTCDCNLDYHCKHACAALLALRDKKFNNFYKVKFINDKASSFEVATLGQYFMSYGIEKDQMMIVVPEGAVFPVDIIQDGKCVFEVIEDDDDLTLSKKLKEFQKK